MARLTHAVKLGDLRSGFKSLAANVRHDIQYDHIGMYAKEKNIDIAAIVNTYDFKRIVNTAINTNTEINHVFNNYAESVDSLNGLLNSLENTSLVNSQFMLAAKLRFGGLFYELNNPKDIEKLKEKLVLATKIRNNMAVLIEPRKGFTVPKNSDKASDELRDFVCKPVINEIVIASMIHGNSTKIQQWRKDHIDSNIFSFGPRVTKTGEFVPYIYEYNLMNAKVNELKKSATSIIATDVRKYFKSIDLKYLNKLFTEIFQSSKQAQFLLKQLKFSYITAENKIERHFISNGLTIESNYQHYISTIFMEYVLNEFIRYHNTLYKNIDDIKFVTYIDDIFMFIKHNEKLSLEQRKEVDQTLYNDFKAFMNASFTLLLNKDKTQFLYRDNWSNNFRNDNSLDIKELIRLPTFNYIEILQYSKELNSENVFTCSDTKITPIKWLNVLKEIVETFKIHPTSGSLKHAVDRLSPIAKRVVYPILFSHNYSYNNFLYTPENSVLNSKFIETFIVERLNEMQFKFKNTISKIFNVPEGAIGYNTTGMVSHRTVYHYSTYSDYLSDSGDKLKRFMKADNIEFYIKNYEKFEYNSVLVEHFLSLSNWDKDGITIIPESHLGINTEFNILEALQYLYLCRSLNTDEITNVIFTSMNLLTMFPNKSRFIAGVIKKQLTRIAKFDIDNSNSDIDAKFMINICLNDERIQFQKFDYFKYCLNKFKIQ